MCKVINNKIGIGGGGRRASKVDSFLLDRIVRIAKKV